MATTVTKESSSLTTTNPEQIKQQQEQQQEPQEHPVVTTITTDSVADHRRRDSNGNSSTVLPRFYPYCCGKPVFRGNPKALAWSLYEIGNYISSIGITVFLGTALLKLAREAAGCSSTSSIPGTNKLVDACHKRVYGIIKPSSILTVYAIVVSVAAALFMPLMGAMVDYTPHRRWVGRVSAIVSCILFVPRIVINKHTWFAVAILQLIFGACIGWIQNVVAYAYLPELTDDEQELNGYIRSFASISFTSMFLYLGMTVALAYAFGINHNDVATAQLGMGVAFVVTTFAFWWAWGFLFEQRPAARQLPLGTSLWTAGFSQLCHTTMAICQQRHDAAVLKWFYLSIAMSDAGVISLASIIVTFFTDALNMSASENGTAVLILLVASVPGAMFSGWSNIQINPIRSSIIALVLLMVVTILAAVVLQQPGQQVASYLLCAGWGVTIGWKWTCDRVVAATIIPSGQEAELMAVYLSSGLSLCWLPPLIYTALNEAGISQRIGLGILSVFWAFALVFLVLFGSYEEALAAAHRQQNDGPVLETGLDVVVVIGTNEVECAPTSGNDHRA